ncbi:MAG: hypothetical protein KDA80_07200 [Planctomycetaceae bacterium]|nr:hypothetical protein [Planctomycetaceae bacterium]
MLFSVVAELSLRDIEKSFTVQRRRASVLIGSSCRNLRRVGKTVFVGA